MNSQSSEYSSCRSFPSNATGSRVSAPTRENEIPPRAPGPWLPLRDVSGPRATLQHCVPRLHLRPVGLLLGRRRGACQAPARVRPRREQGQGHKQPGLRAGHVRCWVVSPSRFPCSSLASHVSPTDRRSVICHCTMIKLETERLRRLASDRRTCRYSLAAGPKAKRTCVVCRV